MGEKQETTEQVKCELTESIFIALDGSPSSVKVVNYAARMVRNIQNIVVYFFHALPMVSPNLLTSEEIRRIEKIHEEMEHLSGFFWEANAEEKMNNIFQESIHVLTAHGISEEKIKTLFDVTSDTVASLILRHARRLKCHTIVVGRRGLGRVKEILLGSTSSTVVRTAKGHTVWVVDTAQEDEE